MRTLALSPDFDALLFWRDEQSQDVVNEAELPISPPLRQELNDLYRWFSELYLCADEPRSDLDNRLFDDRGLELWIRLRSELAGHFTIIYYSQEFAEYFHHPEGFRTLRKA